MGAPQISFLAYYIGAPAHFLRLLYGASSDQFLLIQYGGPSQISFFAYYVNFITIWSPLTSVSLHTIWEGPSDQFLRLLYRGPLKSVFTLTIYYMEPPYISFFAYYMGGALRSVSSLTI